MPSFAIEAEGETIPLSVQDIFRTLAQTSGSGATQQSLQVATKQLGNWEKTPGYYSLLQEVYSDFSLDDGIRLQAIIQLKNGIDKHWRKTSTHPILKDEKQKIKSKAIDVGVQEPKPHLALQNALMLAKIVRYEFPHDWPDVISVVIGHLRSASSLQSEGNYISNVLNITLQIIKELASGRLVRTKRSLETVAPELLTVLGQLYINIVQKWSATDNADIGDLLNSHSALKTLRRLLVVGFEHPHRDTTLKQFWILLQQHYEQFWSAWTSRRQNGDQRSLLLVRHLFQLSKLYLEMARQHPASFVLLGCMDILNRSWDMVSGNDAKAALSGSLDWSVYRNGDVPEDESPIEKLCLKALLLFRACIKMVFNPVQSFKYHHPEDKEDRKTAIEAVKTKVFTNDFIVQLMEILVTQYFVLRPSDLRDWEQEPDEWERREEEIADAWEFSIRSCSEKLFLDLVINFKELLVPRLLQVFRQYADIENHDVLLKDSLYSAIGIAAACIEEILDFNCFIKQTLVPEVQMTKSHYNLLRRRTAIVLGQWVPIKPETLDRVAIYQIFAFLLSASDELNDHVVRVTAGRQLRLVLEPFEFKFEDFRPYATPILENLMSLIRETELSETKMALLETVRVAIAKMEGETEPYAQGIMSVLPTLWTESGEEHLMKQAILTMITTIITSLGKKGVPFHEPIYPLVHDSIQPESEAIVYLLEEALELWAAILQQTPSEDASPQLLALIKSLLPLLDMGSEHLRQCFEILESYAILSPKTILDPTVLMPLMTSQKSMLEVIATARPKDSIQGPHVLETIISTFDIRSMFTPEAQTQALQHLVSSMIDIGYLADLLRILKEAHSYHEDPRPNRRPPDVIGVGETSLFNLLARIALASPSLFIQAVSATGNNLGWLIQEWLGHFDSIGDTIRKKTQCLALTNLLVANGDSSPPPQIMLENLQSLITIWTDLLTELAEGTADEYEGDYLWSGKTELPNWPDDVPEDARKRAVANHDPAYVLHSRQFIADRLHMTMQICGGQAAFERDWLSRVDSAVVKAFAELKLL